MSAAAFGETPFSSEVELWLESPHGKVPLRKVGPHSVVTRDTVTLPPCEAEVVVSIDGERFSRKVYLADGITASSRRVVTREPQEAPF